MDKENGQCIAKLPHSCGTHRGLVVFQKSDDSVDGYCFACDTHVKDPLGGGEVPKRPKKKTEEQIKNEMEEIAKLPSMDLRERKLRKSALDYYGVKVGVDESDGETPAFIYFPYTKEGKVVGYKVKHLPTKKTWGVGNQRDVDFFGWREALKSGAKRLILCEGEADCVALRRILEIYTKESFKAHMPAVVSIPHGAGAAKRDVQRVKSELEANFTHISLCFDQDEAGRKALEEVCKLLPHAKGITLPAKDANDCLVQGLGKAAFKCVTFNEQEVKKSRLVFGEDIHESAREQAKWGELSWPWESIDSVTRGIRFGETLYLGAGTKMGKSELVNSLATHFVVAHDTKVMLCKPEEANKKTHKLLCGKVEGKVFHDPNITFDNEAYDRAGEKLKGKVALIDLYQHLGWESLKKDIAEGIGWGAKAIFIDPITNLTNGMPSSEANVFLQEVAQELSVIAKDENVVFLVFCHCNTPVSGPDHQNGGKVLSSQFTASRAMMRSCNLMVGMQGNKSPDLPEEDRNRRELVLLEDREFGESGVFPLLWSRETGLFKEVCDDIT